MNSAVELLGTSKRVLAGMVIEFFYSGGIVLLSVLAYFVRDGRLLQLLVGGPGFLFLFYFWLHSLVVRPLSSKGAIV